MKYLTEKFDRPSSWEEFIERWGQAKWLYEHIGLLHELYYMAANRFTRKIVDFYIHHSNSVNVDLKYAALRKLLDFIGNQKVDLYDVELIKVQEQILTFLGERKVGALFKPLPYKVLNYLEDFRRVLTHKEFFQIAGRYKNEYDPVVDQYSKVHEEYQRLMPLYVRAMLEWGWAEYLEDDWRRPELIQWIEQYLLEKDFLAAGGYEQIPAIAKILRDPGSVDLAALGVNVQKVINAAAYYKMQHLKALG